MLKPFCDHCGKEVPSSDFSVRAIQATNQEAGIMGTERGPFHITVKENLFDVTKLDKPNNSEYSQLICWACTKLPLKEIFIGIQ